MTISPEQYIYDFSFPEDGGKPNPHLWTNPPMAKCYASIAESAMSKADPANADYYQANAAAYGAKVDQLDRLMIEATASVPAENRELLTYHDAYAYFAAHYGWKVIGAIQVSDFEEPTPQEVTALIDADRASRRFRPSSDPRSSRARCSLRSPTRPVPPTSTRFATTTCPEHPATPTTRISGS